MKFSQLSSHSNLPVLLTPSNNQAADQQELFGWFSNNRSLIDQHLHQAGAILLRGFNILDPEYFRSVAASICPNLRNYTGGDSPRNNVVDKVYTSTEYPAHLEVLLHNELSYAGWFPETVIFGCIQASETGGETQIADGRIIYQEMDPKIKQRFESRGVTYLQHLWDQQGEPGVGKSWQQTFESTDKSEVENYLNQSDMKFQWTSLGLRTAATKAAVRIHPKTGEKCWHNQADQWHRAMDSVKDSVSGKDNGDTRCKSSAGEETLGNHVTYGDGSAIDTLDLIQIRQTSKQNEVLFPWQPGDVMILDNILTMHGRKPFTGDRHVIVAMA